MATSTKSSFSLLLLLLLLVLGSSRAHALKTCMFDAIYQLGDSISDTGNLIRENPNTPFSHLPYDQSFFNNPIGRCFNGLVMLDFFGKHDLPHIYSTHVFRCCFYISAKLLITRMTGWMYL